MTKVQAESLLESFIGNIRTTCWYFLIEMQLTGLSDYSESVGNNYNLVKQQECHLGTYFQAVNIYAQLLDLVDSETKCLDNSSREPCE